MSTPRFTNALMSAQTLPQPSDASGAPEWVHLLPATLASVGTVDARGPYHVTDPEAVIAASFSETDRLPIDENHSTDLAAPQGNPAPARGWITGMEMRADGIWGRVEWTAAGADLVTSRAYRGISPVILHDEDKAIRRILRASLVNKPNLRGLTALHQQQEIDMTFMEQLAKLLGLDAAAGEDKIIGAVKALNSKSAGDAKPAGDAPTLQSQIGEIGVALGLDADAESGAVLNAARAIKSGATEQSGAFTALQAEVTALRDDGKRRVAEAFVDGAIAELRAGVSTERDTYIALHMENPARAEKLVAAMPRLNRTHTTVVPAAKDGEIALNAEQAAVAAQMGQMGQNPKDYAATLTEEAL